MSLTKHILTAVNAPAVQELCDMIHGRVTTHRFADGRVVFVIKTDTWQSNSFGTGRELEAHAADIVRGFLTRSDLGGAW